MFETFSNLEEEKLIPLPVSHVEGGGADPPEDGHPRRPEEAELDQRGVLREAQADLVSGGWQFFYKKLRSQSCAKDCIV